MQLQKITKSNLRKKLRAIAKQYDVGLSFRAMPNCPASGFYQLHLNLITINTHDHRTKTKILKTFFHELGHAHCAANNRWPLYHRSTDMKTVLRFAWQAECWVDRWGQKEVRKFFPKFRYHLSYNKRTKRHDKEYLKEWYSSRISK